MHSVKSIQQIIELAIEDGVANITDNRKAQFLDIFNKDITGRYLYVFPCIKAFIANPSDDKINAKLKIEVEVLGYAISKKFNSFLEDTDLILSTLQGKMEAITQLSLSSSNLRQNREVDLKLKELEDVINLTKEEDIALRDSYELEDPSKNIWDFEGQYSLEEIQRMMFSYIDEI